MSEPRGVRDRRALVVGDHWHDGRSASTCAVWPSTTRSAPCRSRTSCSCCGPVARRPPWSAPVLDACLVAAVDHGPLVCRRRSPPGRSLRPGPDGCRPSPPVSSRSDRSMAPAVTAAMELLSELGPNDDPCGWAARIFDRERAAGRRVPGSGTDGTSATGERSVSSTSPRRSAAGRAAAAERSIGDVVTRHSGRPRP